MSGAKQSKGTAGPQAISVEVTTATDGGVPSSRLSALMDASSEDIGFSKMLKFSVRSDILLTTAAIIAAMVNGSSIPVFTIIFGDMINVLGDAQTNFVDEVTDCVLKLLYLALIAWVSGYVEVGLITLAGYRQTRRLRELYLERVMFLDIAWYDKHGGTGQVLQALNEDASVYQNAISERLGMFIRNITTCVAGLIVAFTKGWDMALVIVAMMPLLVGVGMTVSVVANRLQAMVAGANDEANSIAQEAFVNIKTVASYSLEQQVMVKYASQLGEPRKAGIKQGLLSGFVLGATVGVFSFSYALAVWYGSRKVADGDYTGGQVMNILFAGVMAGFSLGQAVPSLQYFESGKAAFCRICAVIEASPIKAANDDGDIPDDFVGDIEVEHVAFAYPSKPEKLILKDFSLTLPAGKSVALVGDSGSGKSTIIQLLERYYAPGAGQIFIDGRPLASLNLKWWRSQLALVSQTPTLFNTRATYEEVVEAATAANAHYFITRMPNGYDSMVGEQGGQLSGGQKQRIAIARAILRNPKILLLDEATSALDNQSEQIVQESLDKMMAGRSTIVIAHRLSTIVNSDIIAVVRQGKVVEQGNHASLMLENGFYTQLVKKQSLAKPESMEAEEAPSAESNAKSRDELKTAMSRTSVRLSIIPQDIMNKLRRNADKDVTESKEGVQFKRLAKFNKPEWRHALLALLCSIILGLQMPASSLAMAGIVEAFFEPDPDDVRSGGLKWALVYCAIGIVCWFAGTGQGYGLGVMGQNLAVRIKIMFLKSVLRQDGGWFDKEENNSGKLMTRLSQDTMAIRGAVGDQVGVLVQNMSMMVAAYAIAFYSSWKLTLVVTAALPLMATAQIIQTMMLTGQFSQGSGQIMVANQVALEAVSNIKVVAAFSLQRQMVDLYSESTSKGIKQSLIHFAGIAYGFSQFTLYGVIGLAFWYGAKLVDQGDIAFDDLMRGFTAIYFATSGLAQANSQFPEISKAKSAFKRIFDVIDRTPDIDSSSSGGAVLPIVDGDIELVNVTFAYPSRPGRLVFKHFALKIPAATSCALVGESGHGKSTIVGLVERFYDVTDGQVLIDGVNIKSLNIGWVRSLIGLVGQDTVMFRATIMENIRYGRKDATDEEVKQAAEFANALEFIDNFGDKFDTKVGPGGIQLSGGQKQRIAIARAVLRDPKILILDEATSALDSASEAVVQQTLNKLMVGKTTIMVAHRLSTVRKATKIAAVYRGRVLEQGSHDELMALNGYYAYLVNAANH